MDCGAWTQDTKWPYVVRIRGCEFSMDGGELSELCRHIENVLTGHKESLSEDYRDLRIAARNQRKGSDLFALLGTPVKKAKVQIERRL